MKIDSRTVITELTSTQLKTKDHADHAGPSLPTVFKNLPSKSKEDLFPTFQNKTLLTAPNHTEIKDAMAAGTTMPGTTLRITELLLKMLILTKQQNKFVRALQEETKFLDTLKSQPQLPL